MSGRLSRMLEQEITVERRVVVSGIGIVSSIGVGRAAFTESLRSGKGGVFPIKAFCANGFPSRNAGEVQDFDPGGDFKFVAPEDIGRTSQMAIVASIEAITDARLSRAYLASLRCGAAFGTTDGECHVVERLVRSWIANDPASAGNAPMVFSADSIASAVAREFSLTGDAIVLSNACAAGNYAIGHAYDQIVLRSADVMICGGADSLSRKTFAGFTRLGAVAPEICQPFDKNRKGIIPGEGAAALIVEDFENAQARGARIYAEILGYALTCDAKHMVAPDAESIARCMRLAHKRSGILAQDVDYICAHGTGTQTNDVVESAAICDVFGSSPPPTSSIKSMLGHTMGAASALAASACCIALVEGFMPPTINFTEADPRCKLDCVPNFARPASVRVIQNNGFAFGGNNAVVIFKHLPEAA